MHVSVQCIYSFIIFIHQYGSTTVKKTSCIFPLYGVTQIIENKDPVATDGGVAFFLIQSIPQPTTQKLN